MRGFNLLIVYVEGKRCFIDAADAVSLHRPIEHAVLSLSQTATEVLTVFLVMFGSMDLGISIRDALDLKEILKHISEMERVQRAQKCLFISPAVL